MYEPVKHLVLRVLRVPHDPAPPDGSPGSLRVFRASAGYWRYRLVLWALSQAWVVVLAIGAIVGLRRMQDVAPPAIVGLVVVLEVLGLALALLNVGISLVTLRLDYELRWYMVTDRSLRIREGVVHVHEMTLTFANIQNVTIHQGPLQRLLGIADVRVQSAGGGGAAPQTAGGHQSLRDLHVASFSGVDDAAGIRDLVLQRLKRLRDSGLGDHDDPAPEPAPDGAGDSLLEALRELKAETALLREAAAR
jgi:membrane protein YdbS with pleckstrin-like domain